MLNQRSPHHRWVVDEPDIPFEMGILYEDERIIVVDKPHFLPTTPRGMWFRSTALMRLRERCDNPDITPAHRLDRSTAGIVVFVKEPSARGAYQMLFQRREVRKTYECIAPAAILRTAPRGVSRRLCPPAVFPLMRISHISKDRGTIQAYEIAAAPNSSTLIAVAGDQGAVASANAKARAGRALLRVYELHPRSGKTHQLRVHMNALGLPILGDDLYPTLNMRATDDFSQALQLVARSLEFRDPYSGQFRRFTSRIPLETSDAAVQSYTRLPAPSRKR
ncbi:pseudouridine synthase [Bifidobacterium psychraerophilum]|uniref:RNA pseudouridylate synthase n=1 Tax=Bifidobacterium psychraerophilum TaxID=218140 RepID=A0A087CGE2_9BIFI|nr:pseudouridine synthase [Bifidobacterium psychraerophilum]KFI82342.1 23S RNA-specific pseudouridylate synthase [Bifidobacterium psychraerophilum]PKA95144.1 tRNA pseudouridine32 synthase / 23S rRNA pseudouridine746 synthase [Bifidobacterium psychraerophilum DSM 22366]